MARKVITTFSGLAVEAANGTVRDICDATGYLYHKGTKITVNATLWQAPLYSPVGTAVKYLYRENIDYGGSSTIYKQFRQATIKKVLSCQAHVHGTSASVTKGNCFFSWREINSAPTTVGSTLRLYGMRGATGMSSATRVASCSVLMLGT